MLSSLADYLQDALFEMAFKRKTLLLEISNLRRQIALNLLKIAVFGQESTWKKELTTLIDNLADIKLKDHQIKLPSNKYYDKLFEEPFEPLDPWDESYVYNNIVRHSEILKNQKYTKLYHIPINEQNITLIHYKIRELIKNMSILLAERFLNTEKVLVLLDGYVDFWINYAEKSK